MKTELEKKLLSAIGCDINAKRVPELDPNGEFEGIMAYTLEGESIRNKKTKFFAYYGVPKNASGKVPAVVLVHGGGGHAFCCWVKMWNDLGFAAVAMDTTGFMPICKNAGATESDNGEWIRELKGVFEEEGYVVSPHNDGLASADCPLEEQWIFHAVSSALRVNNFLRSREEVDAEKIGIAGISWGSVVTSLAIGYDNRFAFAVPIYGSGYLGEGLSDIDLIFRNEAVKKLWLAEDRFDKVDIPVLWLAWNDDCCFSVQSNSLSYEHTVKNNPKTRISLVDKMGHSHYCGWTPFESYFFACSAVGFFPEMPSLSDNSSGRDIKLSVSEDKKIALLSATLFYIDSSMQYQSFDKFGIGKHSYMIQKWHTVPCKISEASINGVLPQDAKGYYVELKFSYNEKVMTVTTAYKEI